MDVEEFLSELLIAAGGAGVATYAVIKFLATKISDKITIRYENKLEKQMELFRVKTENKKYVTQYRFDQEYKILQKLYQDFFIFTRLCWEVILTVAGNDDERAQFRIDDFGKKCDDYTIYFYQNAVFVKKELAEVLEVTVKKLNEFCNLSIHIRKEYVKLRDIDGTDLDSYETHVSNNLEKLKTIHDEINIGTNYGLKKIEEMIRSYFDTLEVIK